MIMTGIGNKKFAIMGRGGNGKKLQRLFEENGFCFWGYIDNDLKKCYGEKNINCTLPFKAAEFYPDDFQYIIIPESYGTNRINEITSQLNDLGIDSKDIFIATWDMICCKEKLKKEDLNRWLCSCSDWYALPYVEFSAALHCNMNCRSCTHFSPLSEKRFYDFEKFQKDIQRLRQLVARIDTIRIMGGEPLLNPQLAGYITLTRKVYPYSEIQLVTNGLLLKTMKKELIDILLNNRILIHISFYPAIAEGIEDILRFLEDHKLPYTIENMITRFAKVLSKHKIGNPFSPFKPVGCNCPNLFEGYMAVCPRVMFISDLNRTFDTKYPEDGKIDLYDKMLTFEGLKEQLKKAIPLCDYCRSYNYDYFGITDPWRRMEGKAKLEDWQFN